ncbi:spore maturation protein [bacterium]|nr:spore maturation protein [bacterium]
MNFIWAFLILISFVFGALNGKLDDVVNSILSGAESSITIAINICGVMVFWLGIMKIAEKSGIAEKISKVLRPFAKVLFKDASNNENAISNIAMNFSANALGLSNAATPMGIKAMEELQKINKDKSSASDSMCMLLAMNTAGFQLIPATVIAVLASVGFNNPTQIIVPTLLVTSFAFVTAIITAKIMQKFFPPQSETEVQ